MIFERQRVIDASHLAKTSPEVAQQAPGEKSSAIQVLASYSVDRLEAAS